MTGLSEGPHADDDTGVASGADGIPDDGTDRPEVTPAASAPADAGCCPPIDYDGLEAAKRARIPDGAEAWPRPSPPDPTAAPDAAEDAGTGETNALLAGLARAVSAVDGRLTRLEQAQAQETATLANIHQYVAYMCDQQSQSIGARRGLMATSVLDAVAPRIDRIRAMRGSLDGERDALTAQALGAVQQLLTRILDDLGFTTMTPRVGEPYDPHRMECDGFAEGESGKVLEVTRPGYMAGDCVVRVAGVLIARWCPDGSQPEPQGAPDGEANPTRTDDLEDDVTP